MPLPPGFGLGTDIASPWSAVPNSMGSVILADVFGSIDNDLLPVSRAEAMSVPAVARIRRTVCTTVGGLPMFTYSGSIRVVDPVAASYAPVGQPEPNRPAAITYAWTTEALMFYGRAWWVITRRYETTRRPAAFEWVPEWRAELDNDGYLIGHTDGRRFAPEDVVRIDAPDEGALSYGSGSIRTAARLDRAAARASDNPVPSINLHQTTPDRMSDAEIDALIARWTRARSAAGGGVGYTNAAIEASAMGQSVEQLLIDGRRAAALDVARTFGVPAWVVDVGIDGSSLTYSNVQSRSRELIDYGVAPYLEAIAGRLSLDDVLPRGIWCRFDTDALLQDDFAARMAAWEVAIRSGVYTVEEARAREMGVPIEGVSG